MAFLNLISGFIEAKNQKKKEQRDFEQQQVKNAQDAAYLQLAQENSQLDRQRADLEGKRFASEQSNNAVNQAHTQAETQYETTQTHALELQNKATESGSQGDARFAQWLGSQKIPTDGAKFDAWYLAAIQNAARSGADKDTFSMLAKLGEEYGKSSRTQALTQEALTRAQLLQAQTRAVPQKIQIDLGRLQQGQERVNQGEERLGIERQRLQERGSGRPSRTLAPIVSQMIEQINSGQTTPEMAQAYLGGLAKSGKLSNDEYAIGMAAVARTKSPKATIDPTDRSAVGALKSNIMWTTLPPNVQIDFETAVQQHGYAAAVQALQEAAAGKRQLPGIGQNVAQDALDALNGGK